MAAGRLKHVYLVVIIGIFLFSPLFLSYPYSPDVDDLSGTVPLPFDMSFEDPEEEDSSSWQDNLRIFVPTVSSNALLSGTPIVLEAGAFTPPLMPYTPMCVLRC